MGRREEPSRYLSYRLLNIVRDLIYGKNREEISINRQVDSSVIWNVCMAIGYNSKNDTKCWWCKHAVPGAHTGCEWSMYQKPVPGWKAEKTHVTDYDSYLVKECPKFELEV